MEELLKILKDAEKIEKALKIGLAFLHIEDSNKRYEHVDDFGRICFYNEYELINYYEENVK